MQPSAQSSFQKLNVDNNCQKKTKNKKNVILDITFSNLTVISLSFAKYFVQDCRKTYFSSLLLEFHIEHLFLMCSHQKFMQ